MSSTARPTLNLWLNATPAVSACEMAEGISNATVARKSSPACMRALTRLYSCSWCLSPPSRNDAPRMNNVLVTIVPAMDAFTSMYCPARKAASAMTSSARLPSVAFSRPPIASPVLAATDTVARLSSTVNGTMARTDSTKSSVCASCWSCWAANTTGTKASSQSSLLCWMSLSSCFMGQFCPAADLGPRNLLTTAKNNPVDSPHIRMPVNPSTAPTSRHSCGSTRSP